MKKLLLLLTLIPLFVCSGPPFTSGCAAGREDNVPGLSAEPKPDCIRRKIYLLLNESNTDTTLYFRTSLYGDPFFMICCDTTEIDHHLEKILLDSKYLPGGKTTGYSAFILCLNTSGNKKEIGLFMIKNATSRAWEIRRFRVEKDKITGIICLPGVVKEFMTPKEYDSMERIVPGLD